MATRDGCLRGASRHAAPLLVVLFGSRARGTSLPKSDIDLAVEGRKNFDELYDRLQNDLWPLLRVDVVNLDDDISKGLRDEIARDGKVLYEEV